MKKLGMLLCLLAGAFQLASAQTAASGKVIDKNGAPVPGARVSTLDGTATTLTELDGTFRLDSESPTKRIVVDYVGMESRRVRPAQNMTVRLDNSRWGRPRYQGEFWLGYGFRTNGGGSQDYIGTVHGVRFSKHFFAGVGAEYQHAISRDETFFPLFANLKGYLPVKESFMPYLSVNAGYAFGLDNIEGLNVSAGLGFQSRAIHVTIGWQYQGYDKERNFQGSLFVKTGICF